MLLKERVLVITFVLFVSVTLASCGSKRNDEASYPSGDVTIITPFAAGATINLTAHALTDGFNGITGESLVVRNYPGGVGIPATMRLINADPDGYTIAILPSGQLNLRPLVQNVDYRFPDDFTTILGIGDFQMLYVAAGDAPFDNVSELVEYARKTGEEIRIATPGVNTYSHLSVKLVAAKTGLSYRHLPLDGREVAAIRGGHADVAVINLVEVISGVESGDLKLLGVPAAERYENLKDTPTLVEQGIDVIGGPTFGLYGPPGLPVEIVEVLTEVFLEAMESDAFMRFVENSNLLLTKSPGEQMEQEIVDAIKWLESVVD